ncbi:DNA-directed RNA polymerase subunit beta [Sporosarcina limicola]|uniref:DNA-directed RNA polymerase subunit beta n=1 Tax=Sporosarcina limicola TaxID=34101 RepID=A0A927MQU5_9BACL|nr:DNA-directed RNA polymerase subunit beta [Sporosarcina limicola]MBE1555686.1 hypothetical protein [Sporosarcina limicola]
MDDKLNNSKQEESKKRRSTMPATPASRRERKHRKYRNQRNVQVEEETLKKTLWVQIRILPIWLRILLVLSLLTGVAVIGAMIGYSYIGNGEPGDVLKKETWTHIFDIIKGKES